MEASSLSASIIILQDYQPETRLSSAFESELVLLFPHLCVGSREEGNDLMGTIVPDVQLQVHACLRYLAAHRDGEQDGFRPIDAAFGRQLAEMDLLTLAQTMVGARLLRTYRRPLETAGLGIPTHQEIEASLGTHQTPAPQRQAALRSGPVPGTSLNEVLLLEDRLVVKYAYDRAKYEAMVALKAQVPGWLFNFFGLGEWSFPLGAVTPVLEALKPFGDFVYSDDIPALVEQARAKKELARQQARLQKTFAELERKAALDAVQPFLTGEPVANGQVLYAHQREAVQLLIERKRVILAHDLGLGKTRSALLAAKGYELPVLVICPASLRINWLREAEAVPVPIQVSSWAKLPEPPEEDDYILIADEAHYAQTLKAKRTQGFLSLAGRARAVYALTGTPMKNGRPINLFPLLAACKHPLAQDRRAYEQRYCNAHLRHIGGGRQVYDVSGASHLDELHTRVRDVLLYKKKEECLKDLPPKVRVMRRADISPEAKRTYQTKIDQLRQEHQHRMQQKWSGCDAASRQELAVTEATLDEEMDDGQGEALVELGIERQAGSLIKVQSAIDIAQEVLEQGESIVLFTAYRESAHKIAEALDAECLSGDSEPTGEKRQAMIDRFQAGVKRALVCLIGTGGLGHTLTAAQTVVLVDRPWTPGEAEQCEDRLHRIGQQGSVTAIWLQYGPVDERIDALLQRKQERIDLVVEGERKSIRSMAKEILESARHGTSIEQLLDLAHQRSQGKEQHSENSKEDAPSAHPDLAQEQPGQAGLPELLIADQPIEASSRDLEHVTLSPPAENHLIEPEGQAQAEEQKKDGRLKGAVPRVRVNIMLDEQIVAFLRSMRASNQTSSKEGGYSGFLEQLVRASEEFQAYLKGQD